MQAGVLNEVLFHGGGNGRHVADVFHHSGNGNGGHNQDGGQVKLSQHKGLDAHSVRRSHAGEIHLVGNQSHRVGDQHAQ